MLNSDKQIRVTAVVVNWNAGSHLVRCVDALLAQQRVDMDVVVVDNASSDDSLSSLHPFGDRVRVVQTGANLGFGRGVNRGIAACEAEWIVALNPDVVLTPDAAVQMIEFMVAHPQVGLVGPRLKDANGQVHASCGMAPRLTDEICRKFLLHLIFPLFKFRVQRPQKPSAVGWVTGACFAVRRQAFDAVGGLDEAIFMYYEDVDLGLRLNRAGWQVYFLPFAEGTHIGGESSRQALTQMLMVSEASYMFFIKRHLGRFAALVLTCLRPVEMMLRSLLWCAVFVLQPERRQEARSRLRAYRALLFRGLHAAM